MTGNKNSPKKNCLNGLNTNTKLNKIIEEEDSTEESSSRKYMNGSDYDEAYKNLLCSINSVAKKKPYEPLQYNFFRELDSYLNHLKKSTADSSSVFVEAALVFQNVLLLYQKRADHLIDDMIKLIGNFRAYRLNQTDDTNEYVEHLESNHKNKKEKKIKFYPFFNPIKGQIFRTLKNFDYKVIDLSKKSTVPKTVLNSNIKVESKYSRILPYIFSANREHSEHIGKKYDFMVNYPLNCDLAVNDEFDYSTNENPKFGFSLKYQKNFSLFPMNLMDVDGIDFDDTLPRTPDGIVFNQTVKDEICVANAVARNPPNTLNISQIPPKIIDDDDWATVLNNEEMNYTEKPICLTDPLNKDTELRLSTFKFGESRNHLKLKFDLHADPVFRKLVHVAHEIRRSNVKKINKHFDEFNFGHYGEMEEALNNSEILESESSNSSIYIGEFLDVFRNADECEQPLLMSQENVELYKEDGDVRGQNQEKIMNEQLKMIKRVQIWHDNLRPILEEEEKKSTYDIHEYGTCILNSFKSKGEQKSFKELFGGLKQEEVARYFLSTLIMTNSDNLKIIASHSESEKEIKVECLKKKRHHEELQNYIGNQDNQKLKL